jgi:pimeloyl-ACP methyl ester carboxylesterase
MGTFNKLIFLVGIILVTSCASHTATVDAELARTKSTKPKPRGDGGVSPFYSFPSDSMPKDPGVFLRDEPLESHQSIPGAAKGVRLLYTSTDGLGGELISPVSGALFLPKGNAPEGGWPIVLWSHGTVGIADVCAPSWTGYVPFHEKYLKQWLDQGYAIVASDYQGLGTSGTHPYLATRPAAYSNLDIVRAVQSTDHPLSTKVVVIGQSQGAGAAIATAAHAPSYAPEIDLLGVVATGVPYFSPETLIAIQEARPSNKVDPLLGYNFLALTLIEQLVPEFKLADYVFESVLSTANAVTHVCNRDMRKRIEEEGLTYDNTFKASPNEPLKVAFAQMGFPTLEIEIPIYLGTGSIDRDTPPRMQAALARKACSAGASIQAFLYDGFDHLTVLNHSTIDSIPFVEKLMSGDSFAGNCESLPYD